MRTVFPVFIQLRERIPEIHPVPRASFAASNILDRASYQTFVQSHLELNPSFDYCDLALQGDSSCNQYSQVCSLL